MMIMERPLVLMELSANSRAVETTSSVATPVMACCQAGVKATSASS